MNRQSRYYWEHPIRLEDIYQLKLKHFLRFNFNNFSIQRYPSRFSRIFQHKRSIVLNPPLPRLTHVIYIGPQERNDILRFSKLISFKKVNPPLSRPTHIVYIGPREGGGQRAGRRLRCCSCSKGRGHRRRAAAAVLAVAAHAAAPSSSSATVDRPAVLVRRLERVACECE